MVYVQTRRGKYFKRRSMQFLDAVAVGQRQAVVSIHQFPSFVELANHSAPVEKMSDWLNRTLPYLISITLRVRKRPLVVTRIKYTPLAICLFASSRPCQAMRWKPASCQSDKRVRTFCPRML